MKLIDLLVRELPKRGGWPALIKGIDLPLAGNELITSWKANTELNQFVSVTYGKETITREQYEAAIAAAQQPVWDGEGFPPVGCECERSWCGDKWLRCTVLFVSDETIVVKLPTRENAYRRNDVKFRPLRSEADKKRAEGVIALSRVDPSVAPFEYGAKHSDGSLIGPFWYELYDAIAAGKIPHIRIE